MIAGARVLAGALAAAIVAMPADAGGSQNPAPVATAPPQTAVAAPARPEYRLRPGDVIEIRLFFHSELNQETTIRPDGRISFPLIPDQQAEGRTPAELATALGAALGAELRNATTAVIVKRFADQRVYVGGEVVQPGVIQLTGATTVLQAVMQAGGFRQSARSDQIAVLRAAGPARTDVLLLDLRVPKTPPTADQHLALNFSLEPLDVVIVPKSRIASANDFVEQYVTKLVPIQYILGVQFYPFGFPIAK